MSHPLRAGLAAVLVAALFTASANVLLAADEGGAATAGWWPEDRRPPYASLAPVLRDDDRAVLLKNAAFLTHREEGRTAAASAIPAALRGRAVEEGGWLLVQFRAEVPAPRRAELLALHGATATEPVPRHVHLAHLPPGAAGALDATDEVVWIGRFHPAFKLSPLLGRTSPDLGPLESDGAPLRLSLQLAPVSDPAAVRAKLETAGARIIDRWHDGALVEIAVPRVAAALARLDSVLFVEPYAAPRLLNDSSRGICQGGAPGLDTVHDQGVRGDGQIVTVMDSGLDDGHCCFDGAAKIVDYRAWGGGRKGAGCSSDHGTHTSGTAVCSNEGDHDGLAPDAQLIMQDVGRDDTFACLFGSISPPSSLASAWQDAYDRGSRIHSNSWGGGGNSYGGNARSIDDFTWDNQDFLILFAAGNSGSSPGTLSGQSNAKNSLTVGASRNGSSYENLWSASSRGPAGDGRLLPDLITPGASVSSALNKSSPSCGFWSASGTSMAAPGAAGAAALVREYFAAGYYPSGTRSGADGFSPSAALVKATMLLSTRNMTGSGTNGDRPNADQGFGRLTLDDALWFANEPASEQLVVLDDRNMTTGFDASGEEDAFDLEVDQSGSVRIVLAWTDAAAALGANPALVNDLDLTVRLPDGTTYRGNKGFAGGWTTTASSEADRLNNKELVALENVSPGTVRVTVRAHAINATPGHPQDYALVAVGPFGEGCDEPVPEGVGNTARHEREAGELEATWAERGAHHYVVYRGTTPDFMSSDPAPYANDVVDEDPVEPDVQWTDVGALSDGATYFYVYRSANACGAEAD
jgi:subtilisin family serine protease